MGGQEADDEEESSEVLFVFPLICTLNFALFEVLLSSNFNIQIDSFFLEEQEGAAAAADDDDDSLSESEVRQQQQQQPKFLLSRGKGKGKTSAAAAATTAAAAGPSVQQQQQQQQPAIRRRKREAAALTPSSSSSSSCEEEGDETPSSTAGVCFKIAVLLIHFFTAKGKKTKSVANFELLLAQALLKPTRMLSNLLSTLHRKQHLLPCSRL